MDHSNVVVKKLKPGVLEFSGPELLLRMIEQEVGVHRPKGKTVMECIAEIEGMAEEAGPESVAVVNKLKGLTRLCNEYFNEVVEQAAAPQQ